MNTCTSSYHCDSNLSLLILLFNRVQSLEKLLSTPIQSRFCPPLHVSFDMAYSHFKRADFLFLNFFS